MVGDDTNKYLLVLLDNETYRMRQLPREIGNGADIRRLWLLVTTAFWSGKSKMQ
jgi:hypothetical protein